MKAFAIISVLFLVLGMGFFVGCGDDEEAVKDITAPVVSITLPANAATGVALNVNVIATFSESMDPATLTGGSFTLKQGETVVPAVVTVAGLAATLNPTSNLAAQTVYVATITTAAKDLAGNALVTNKTWSFTTGDEEDLIAPTVVSTIPVAAATNVAVNANITATFSEVMDPAPLLVAGVFTLKQGSTTIPCGKTYLDNVWTLNPDDNLESDTVYTVTITTAAVDLAGNPLAETKTWNFTTGTAPALGPDPVILGRAGNYTLLTKTGIVNVPTSIVIGDIGVSPIFSDAITGFSGGLAMDGSLAFSTTAEVSGRVYAPDYTGGTTAADLTLAVQNMEAAYTNAAGRLHADFTNLHAGLLGGKTLVPGLYNWDTQVLITTNVTLDGGPNDVWILQVAGYVTIDAGVRVVLTGGAKAENVFWAVAQYVNVGAGGHIEGVVLSMEYITLVTGASARSRFLSQTAVSLGASAVTNP